MWVHGPFVPEPEHLSLVFNWSERLGFKGLGFRVVYGYTHRLLSSSFLGLPYRVLNINHKKELLRSLWVVPRQRTPPIEVSRHSSITSAKKLLLRQIPVVQGLPGLPIGSIFPLYGLYLGSYKTIPKRSYNGAYMGRVQGLRLAVTGAWGFERMCNVQCLPPDALRTWGS